MGKVARRLNLESLIRIGEDVKVVLLFAGTQSVGVDDNGRLKCAQLSPCPILLVALISS